MKKLTEYLTEMIPSIIHRVNVLKTSPERKDSPNDQDPTIVVPANKRATLLEGGNSMKIGGMWTLKHEISSPEFYELLIKTELKLDTDVDLKNFYKHIKMCLNAVTRLR